MYSGFHGNTPFSFNRQAAPGVTPDSSPRSGTEISKAGKAFVKALDSLSFDANIFAYYVVSHCRGVLRKRLMAVVFAFIRSLSERYDVGDMDDETMNAKRLMDTMATYGMDGENPE